MIKLIASDVDGTLLRGGEDTPLPTALPELILRLKEKGMFFVAASGRQYPNLRRVFGPVQDEIGYVCENGCLAFWENRKIHKALMEQGLAHELIRAALELSGAEVLISGEQVSYISPENQEYYRYIRDVLKNEVVFLEDIYQLPEEYMKVSVYRKDGVGKIVEDWKCRFAERVTVATAGFTWLDNMPLQTNKAAALDQILKRLGIAPDECMAFGDEYNDLEMLKKVKYGFAVDTARTKVKETCTYHTSSVADVLAQVARDEFKEEQWNERI